MEINLNKSIQPKSDQLNADDLVGGAKTITIRDIKLLDSDTQPVSIFYDGDNNKPYKPSKGMRRVLVQIWGADGSLYVGRKITLYRNDDVKFGGEDVGGIRISHVSHIKEAVRVLETVSRSKRRPITIHPIIEKAKEVFNENHPRWILGIEALKSGKTTIQKVQDSYDVSEDVLNQITELLKVDSNGE